MYPKTWELMEWSWGPTSEGPMGYTNSGVSKMGNLKIIRLTSFHGKPMVFVYPLFKKHPIGCVEILCNLKLTDTGNGSNFGLVGYFDWVLTTKNCGFTLM